mmetsp:Transcript_14645/g.32453  ORF Transcript_14645/g.32453 Transcript_14645/m.32453 type:complete len:83 (-) Transcript_14645:9-257(-)
MNSEHVEVPQSVEGQQRCIVRAAAGVMDVMVFLGKRWHMGESRCCGCRMMVLLCLVPCLINKLSGDHVPRMGQHLQAAHVVK